MTATRYVPLLALALGASPIHAQRVADLPRIEAGIQIDGVVDEAPWDAVAAIPITQKVPNAGAPPSQRTEIRIAYDDNNLYLSGRLFDEESDRIVANTTKRDDFTENTEWVGLLIDTYDDRESALGFWVTPTGARLDMSISNDAQGSQGINVDWNGYWDAAATRDEDGWYAEIRIPFSTLPFTVDDGSVVMGITTWRYIARTDETAAFPPRDASTGSSFRPSLTRRFRLRELQAPRSITSVPYLLVGQSRSRATGGAPPHVERVGELGVDVRLGLGPGATLDITANTDFAEVEVDDQQVNLGRAALFFPERRLFFQERASLFDFSFGLSDRAFYSRRVGIVGQERTRIYGGARFVGRMRDVETGLLSMQTAGSSAGPSENFSVLRLRRRVINENSTVGLIGTSRVAEDGGYSVLYGVDATVRAVGENFIAMRWAQTFDSDSNPQPSGALDRSRLFLELADRSPSGLTYAVSYDQSASAFEPAVGFQGRSDFRQATYSIAHNTFPGAESPWVQYGPFVSGSSTWSYSTGSLESRESRIGLALFTKTGWSATTYAATATEVLIDPLTLSGGVQLDPGRYSFGSLGGTVAAPSAYRVSGSATASGGRFYDGRILSAAIAPVLTATPNLIVNGRLELNRISRSAGPTHLTLASLGAEYYVDTKLSFSVLGQYNSASDRIVANARVRFNPREGEDLYLVVNGGMSTLPWSTPDLREPDRINLQLKYSRPFRTGF